MKNNPFDSNPWPTGTFSIGIMRGTFSGNITLEELSDEETSDKKFLGAALGIDLKHCLYLGIKFHDGEFLSEAKWFHYETEIDEKIKEIRKYQPQTRKVNFYGDLHENQK